MHVYMYTMQEGGGGTGMQNQLNLAMLLIQYVFLRTLRKLPAFVPLGPIGLLCVMTVPGGYINCAGEFIVVSLHPPVQ